MEIGVREGISTSAILAGIEENGGHLWSFDINDCRVFDGHPDWTFMQADTIADSAKVRAAIPSDIQMLFVDGDHSYEGALSDLENFGPLARRIFVHDTDCPDTYPGVRKAVEEFISKSGRSVRWHSGSYGMAEIE